MQRSLSLKSTRNPVGNKGIKRMWSRKDVMKIDTVTTSDSAAPATSPSTSPAGSHGPVCNMSTVCRLVPPRKEKRYVFLDAQEGHFGFTLETYFRQTDKQQTYRTFVQNVNPQSVSFMAGLVAGDTIVEINGVDVRSTPADLVVKMIQACKGRDTKIKLTVEFVDGVMRLEMMKERDALRRDLKQKQQRLKELLEKESPLIGATCNPGTAPSSSNSSTNTSGVAAQDGVLSEGWEVWESWGTTVFQKTSHLNPVVLYAKEAVTLTCDVMVIPLSSCIAPPLQDNVLYQYLQHGGSGLWDELSLVKQGKLGDVIATGGHGLPVQRIYHCIIGSDDDSAQLCIVEALRLAHNEGHQTVAFWVDGFTCVQVSSQKLVESVRQWLAEEDRNKDCFRHIIFSCSPQLREQLSVLSI